MTEKTVEQAPNAIVERTEAFTMMDKKDEEMILKEIRGEVLEDLVYDILIGGKRVVNLSYAGVKEAIRRRGGLEILSVETSETEKTIRALVKVRDLRNRIDVLGASEAEKEKPFSYTLAVNKAERNAFAKLIPAKWLATLVDDFIHANDKPTTQAPTQAPAHEQQQASARMDIPADVDPVSWVKECFPPDLQELLDFKRQGDYVLVRGKQYLLNDQFVRVAETTKSISGVYVSAGKDSHFRVPLKV